MEFRVEKKYLITQAQILVLKSRLAGVMQQDIHQTGDSYTIKSLYMDDIWESCLDENDAGVDQRKKYRIRYYGEAFDRARLEIKQKLHGMTHKDSCALTPQECRRIVDGCVPVGFDERAPLNALRLQMRTRLMRPKAVIEYQRSAFVYEPGNVRITFDQHIMASDACHAFLEMELPRRVPLLGAGMHILEVKYDELLPDYIAQLLELDTLEQTAFSKYYLGVQAMRGESDAWK